MKRVPKKDRKYVQKQLSFLDENFMNYVDYWNEKYYRNGFVDKDKFDLPKNKDCTSDEIFFIPKDLCNLSNGESSFKTVDDVHEEVYYHNYLQLKDGAYNVVDKDGNEIQYF